MIIHKAALARVRITQDEAIQKLTSEFLDLSMFIAHEDADELRWTLRPARTLRRSTRSEPRRPHPPRTATAR